MCRLITLTNVLCTSTEVSFIKLLYLITCTFEIDRTTKKKKKKYVAQIRMYIFLATHLLIVQTVVLLREV
jgi:hypothetical protein